MSKGIVISKLEYGTFINCEGVIFKAIAPIEDMILLQHDVNYWEGRRCTITGLEIRGDYKVQHGISIKGVQEWFLPTVRIHECFTGLYLEDVWYGEISGEPIIQDCLTGIGFGAGISGEINTLAIYNLKMNFSVSKTLFYPKNEGETDADYNLRVRSVGVTLGIILGGIGFDSIVVEGYEYGFKYIPSVVGSGIIAGMVSIKNGYFEAISKKYFDFSEAVTTGYNQAIYQFDISTSRFFDSETQESSVFAEGTYRIIGNQPFSATFIHGARNTRISAEIDNHVNLTQLDINDTQLFIKRSSVPTSAEQRFSDWSSDSVFPDGDNMIGTLGHSSFFYTNSSQQIRGFAGDSSNSKIFDAYSIMSRPIVFLPVKSNKNGPVIKGDDGKWYMIQINTSGLYTREILNRYRIDETSNSKTARELSKLTTEPEGTQYRCIDLDGLVVTLKTYGGSKKWCAPNLPVIDTTQNLLTLVSDLNYNQKVVDLSTGQTSISIEKTHYCYVDWFGKEYLYNSFGTVASRPLAPEEGFVYYATDESLYYKYTGGVYVAFTPYAV